MINLSPFDREQTKRRNKMNRLNIKTATLEELEDKCLELMGTPFGHNMIGIICNQVKNRFGKEEAERLYDSYQM